MTLLHFVTKSLPCTIASTSWTEQLLIWTFGFRHSTRPHFAQRSIRAKAN